MSYYALLGAYLKPARINHSNPSHIFSPSITAGIDVIAKCANINQNPLSMTKQN